MNQLNDPRSKVFRGKDEDRFIKDGDLIQFEYQSFGMFSQGFVSDELIMRQKDQDQQIERLFQVKKEKSLNSIKNEISQGNNIQFFEIVTFMHVLSNKYLTFLPELNPKFEVKLKAKLSKSCYFFIKPHYSCQMLDSKNLKSEEGIILSYSSSKVRINQINESMNIVLNRTQNSNNMRVCLRKNQKSQIKLIKKNSKDNLNFLNHLSIYQLKHTETSCYLANLRESNSESSKNKNIKFIKQQNNYLSYIRLVRHQKQVTNQLINSNHMISIQFYSDLSYLSLSQDNLAQTSRQPNFQSIFRIEGCQGDSRLTIKQPVKLLHTSTSKYLSQIQSVPIAQNYKIFNTFIFQSVDFEQKKIIFFVHKIYKVLTRQTKGQALTFQNRKKIKQYLKQIILFIYDKNQQIQFLKMKQNLKTNLTIQQQNIFCSIQFLKLFSTIISLISLKIEERAKQKKQKSVQDQNEIFLSICQIVTAVVLHNYENTSKLIPFLKQYLQFIGKSQGVIQMLYYIFKDSPQSIKNMSSKLQLKFKKQTFKGISVILESFQFKQFINEQKIKIIRFLSILLMPDSEIKESKIENKLIAVLRQNKLKNIFLDISGDSNNEIIFTINQKQEKLIDILTLHQNKYFEQIEIIKQQLNLIVCLWSGQNIRNGQDCVGMIKIQTAKKYIEYDICSKFKQIFYKILINSLLVNDKFQTSDHLFLINFTKRVITHQKTFLKSSYLSNRLLSNDLAVYDKNEQVQLNANEMRCIKTVEFILNFLNKFIQSKITLSRLTDFNLNLGMLNKILKLQLCDVKDIESIFNFILATFQLFYNEQVFINQLRNSQTNQINICVNKIVQFFQIIYKIAIRQKSLQLIKKLIGLQHLYEIQKKQLCKKVIQNYRQFVKDQFFTSKDLLFIILPKAIQISVKHNHPIQFQKLSHLLYLLSKRSEHILLNLSQSIIIIGDSWARLKYMDMIQKRRNLQDHFRKYMHDHKNNDKKIVGRQICQILEQLCRIMLEQQSQISTIVKVNIFLQHLITELNILQIIFNFIYCQNQILWSSQLLIILRSIFKFLNICFHKSNHNVTKYQKNIGELNFVFERQDVGQHTLLLQILKSEAIQSRILISIKECLIKSIINIRQPKIQIIMSLYYVFKQMADQSYNSKLLGEQFLQNFIQDLSYLHNLLMIGSKQFKFSFIESDSNYHQQWAIYLSLLLKCIILLLGKSGQLKDKFKKILSSQLVLKIILQSYYYEDVQSNISNQASFKYLKYSLRFLREQAVIIFQQVYLSEMPQMQQCQFILNFIQKVLEQQQSIAINRQSSERQFELMAKRIEQSKGLIENKEEQKLLKIRQYLDIQIEFKKYQSEEQIYYSHINYQYNSLTLFYPFLFKLTYKIKHQNYFFRTHSTAYTEISVLANRLFEKYKQIVTEQVKFCNHSFFKKGYISAIKLIQEITNKVIKKNSENQETSNDAQMISNDEYFLNCRIRSLVHRFINIFDKTQKRIYESLIILMNNQEIKEINLSINISPLNFQSNTITQTILKYFIDILLATQKQRRIQLQKLYILHFFLTTFSEIRMHAYEYILQKFQVLFQLVYQNDERDSRYINLTFEVYFAVLKRYVFAIRNKINKIDSPLENKFYSSKLFQSLIEIKISNQIAMYNHKLLFQQQQQYFNSILLNFQHISSTTNIQLILELLKLKVQLNFDETSISKIIWIVCRLLTTYLNFIAEFETKYITEELISKIEICLQIIFHSIKVGNNFIIQILNQNQIYKAVNFIFQLPDDWNRQFAELEMTKHTLLNKLQRINLFSQGQSYIQGVSILYRNSLELYGQSGLIISELQFPLMPAKSIFGQLKHKALQVIKQIRTYKTEQTFFFIQKLSIPSIDQNILSIYQKHANLYPNYQISSIQYQILFPPNNQYYDIARNTLIKNGVQFVALKMELENISGNPKLLEEYYSYRLKASATSSNFYNYINQFTQLIFSLLRILFEILTKFISRKKPQQLYTELNSKILEFFYSKLARVQVNYKNQLFGRQFMIYPECTPSRKLRSDFQKSINFGSNQLKRESILLWSQYFNFYYGNELQFYKKFNSYKIIVLFAKHFELFKIISYCLVITNNIFLLVNTSQESLHAKQLNFTHPFGIIAIINLLVSLIVLLIYVVKETPLLFSKFQYDLRQGFGYFGVNYKQKSESQRYMILWLKVLLHPRLLYHVIYTIIVSLVLYDKIFVSLLLLDVLGHIPELKTILMSIWQPKISIILAIIVFILFQYFFSILTYFFYKDKTLGYCNYLGYCFSFIFVSAFNSIHGFVGYLFDKKNLKQLEVFDSFQLFQNIYVIISEQLIIALVYAIIIDSFIVSKTSKIKQYERLNSACLICNLDRSVFNLQSKLFFKGHKAINHNIFNYFCYKYSILKTSCENRGFFEVTVVEMSDQWLPNEDAIEIRKGKKGEEQDINSMI